MSSDWLWLNAFMFTALALAAAKFLHTQVTQARAHRVLDDYWTKFWAGRTQVHVTILGEAGASVRLGALAGEPNRHQQDVTSAGFAIRTDDGRVIDVVAGTRVSIYADNHRVVDGAVEVPAGLRLAARLEEVAPVGDGPLRTSAETLRVPDDLGLILSDRDLRQTPMKWTSRVTRLDRWALLVAIAVACAALSTQSPRLFALPILFGGFLALDTIGLRGGILALVCTREAFPVPAHVPPRD